MINKWLQTIKVSIVNQLAYKLDFFLKILGPAIIFLFIKVSLWQSIYQNNNEGLVGGYSLESMLLYQLWVLVVGLIAKGYSDIDLAQDIRYGRVSAFIIYPFSFFSFHLAKFFGFQFIQLLVVSITLLILTLLNFKIFVGATFFLQGLFITLLVALLWFQISFIIGLLAFWLEETWVIRVIILMLSSFLSGDMIPLDLYPVWLQELLFFTPFPYLTYVPVKILMGEYSGSMSVVYASIIFWMLLVGGLGQFMWRRGLRLYSGAGI